MNSLSMGTKQTSMSKYSKTIKPIYGKMISQHYQSLLTELQSVVDLEDKELVESYSYMKRSELRRFVKLIKETLIYLAKSRIRELRKKQSKERELQKRKTKPKKPKNKQIYN